MLDLDIDPKLAWALKNRDRFPVDVNKAGPRACCSASRHWERAPWTASSRRAANLRLADIGRLTRALRRAPAIPDRGRPSPHACSSTAPVFAADAACRARSQLDLFA